MFIVYRAYSSTNDQSYYGYAQGETIDDVKKSFLTGANRSDDHRADVKFLDANGGDADLIKIQVLDVFNDELEAWMTRNDIRSTSVDSVTGPTNFPCGIAQRAAKDHPERVEFWKKNQLQRNAKNARAAWSLGLWENYQIVGLQQSHSKQQIITDLDLLLPSTFAIKYNLPI